MSDTVTDEKITQSSELPQKRSLIRRLGCIGAVVLWFILVLTPCVLIFLATRGEISITTGSAPEQRVRVWLVMEARSRGLGVSNAFTQQINSDICVQTDVRFLLWQGEEEPSSYCECYTQEEATWNLTQTITGACETTR